MADRSTPELDDLDQVFDAITRDVDIRSLPPGAERAVRTVRRRRTLQVLGVVAALVVVCGVGAGFLPQRSTVEFQSGTGRLPASSEPQGPAAQRLTLDRLNQTAEGWATWQYQVNRTGLPAEVPCLPDNGTDPALLGQQIEDYSRDAKPGEVSLQRLRFSSRDASNHAMLVSAQQLTTGVCPQAHGAYNTDFTAELEVVAGNWKAGDRRGTTFLINHGDRMDVLTVTGITLPEDMYEKLSSLIAADVQVP